jgi:hypothetical protein
MPAPGLIAPGAEETLTPDRLRLADNEGAVRIPPAGEGHGTGRGH